VGLNKCSERCRASWETLALNTLHSTLITGGIFHGEAAI